MIAYQEILDDEAIQSKYKQVDEASKNSAAFRGWGHVLGAIEIAKKILKAIDAGKDVWNAVMIGVALHDIGKEFIDGKKNHEAHGEVGYEYAKEYLKDYDFPHKEEALDGIRFHDKDYIKDSLVAELICFSDKFDLTSRRLREHGKEMANVRQLQYLKDFDFALSEDSFKIAFLVTKDFDRVEWLKDYFTPKVFAAAVNLGCLLDKPRLEVKFKTGEFS